MQAGCVKFNGLLFRWVCGLVILASVARGDERRIELSDTEAAWVRENPVVRFGYDPDWGPFTYRDDRGELTGIDREFLELLGKRLGLRFEPAHAENWTDAYSAAQAGASDILVSTAEDAVRGRDFLFTRPYNSFPVAFVARHDSPVIISMEQLRGRRVALAEGHIGTLIMEREHPEVERVMVKTMEEAFMAVAGGRADVALTNIANANYVIRSLGLANLRVAGVVPYLFELRYAVRKDLPVLRDILDKGVASLSAKDRQAILSPWVSVEYPRIIRWNYIARWGAGVLVVAGAFAFIVVRSNRRLKKELDDRARIQRELENTKRRLEELNEEKSGLMRMAAHDLRSPLTGLMLSIEVLAEKSAGEHREALTQMMELAQQMAHMISNLLDVQALDDGRRRLDIERVELGAEVADVIAGMTPAADRKNIKLSCVIAPGAPSAKADRSAVNQVITNLVSNAIKYSPSDRTVVIDVVPANAARVAVRVSDQGPGIRPDEMPRLFQKYACLSARPTGGEQSTGLGLAIVKQLVVAMGGTVRCECPPEGGARFVVELPADVDGRADFAGESV